MKKNIRTVTKDNLTGKRNIVRRRGEAVISTEYQRNKEEPITKERRQAVDDLPEHPAFIQVSGGMTKNLGNYESCKLGISISVPCATDEESIRETYQRVSDLLDELMQTENDKLMG